MPIRPLFSFPLFFSVLCSTVWADGFTLYDDQITHEHARELLNLSSRLEATMSAATDYADLLHRQPNATEQEKQRVFAKAVGKY